MSLSQNTKKISIHILSFFMAINFAILTTVIVPTAQAATGASYYQVELKEVSKKDKKIIRGTMIRCTDTNCRGKKAVSNTASMCAKIARTFGPIKSFFAGGEAFDESKLAKCNEKA